MVQGRVQGSTGQASTVPLEHPFHCWTTFWTQFGTRSWTQFWTRSWTRLKAFHGDLVIFLVQNRPGQNRPILKQEFHLWKLLAKPGPRAASGGPRITRIAKNLPCPEGVKVSKSTDSWPFAGGVDATVTKVAEVVIYDLPLSSAPRNPGIQLSPLQFRSSAIMC